MHSEYCFTLPLSFKKKYFQEISYTKYIQLTIVYILELVYVTILLELLENKIIFDNKYKSIFEQNIKCGSVFHLLSFYIHFITHIYIGTGTHYIQNINTYQIVIHISSRRKYLYDFFSKNEIYCMVIITR